MFFARFLQPFWHGPRAQVEGQKGESLGDRRWAVEYEREECGMEGVSLHVCGQGLATEFPEIFEC